MILVHLHGDPRPGFRGREQEEVLATLAAFGLPLTVVLGGQAVRLLLETPDAEAGLLEMLADFGIEVLVRAEDDGLAMLRDRTARVPFRIVPRAELGALARQARHTLNL